MMARLLVLSALLTSTIPGATWAEEAEEETSTQAETLHTLGWVNLGSGLAVLSLAIALDVAWTGGLLDDLEVASRAGDASRIASVRDELDASRAVTATTYAFAGAVVFTGVTFFILASASPSSSPSGQRSAIAPWMRADGAAGLTWLQHW